MKVLRFLGLCLLMVVALSSCVDEINLVLEDSNQAIVIDAWIGNNPQDTYVKVYRTGAYVSGVLNPNYTLVPTKSVKLEQSEGADILFFRDDDQVFRTNATYQPVPGKSYRLVVETEAGDVYESSWEVMPPSVQIIDLEPTALERQVLIQVGTNQFLQTRTFAEIRAKIKDPGLGDYGYLIQTDGISELYTSSLQDNCACACYERDPNIFSGMNVTSNEAFKGKEFGISVGEIPLSYIGRFYAKSTLKVVTKSNFQYLKQVDLQQRNSGSIFDPAPFRINGNIKKRGEENSLVLGSFFLFQETDFGKLLYRSDIRNASLNLNHTLEAIPQVNASCQEFYPTASPVAPQPFRP